MRLLLPIIFLAATVSSRILNSDCASRRPCGQRQVESVVDSDPCCDVEIRNVEHPVRVQQHVHSDVLPQQVRHAERAFPLVAKPPPSQEELLTYVHEPRGYESVRIVERAPVHVCNECTGEQGIYFGVKRVVEQEIETVEQPVRVAEGDLGEAVPRQQAQPQQVETSYIYSQRAPDFARQQPVQQPQIYQPSYPVYAEPQLIQYQVVPVQQPVQQVYAYEPAQQYAQVQYVQPSTILQKIQYYQPQSVLQPQQTVYQYPSGCPYSRC